MPSNNYSFHVNGLSIGQLKDLQDALEKTGKKGEDAGEKASKAIEKVSENLDKLKDALAGDLIGNLDPYEYLKSAKENYRSLQNTVVSLGATLKSTDFAAGFSAMDLSDMADKMSEHMVASKQEILEAMNVQAGFTNIRGPVFKEAIQAAADFAAKYQTTVGAAAQKVDTMLSNPVKHLADMEDQGIIFTAEQEKQIRNCARHNNLLGEQKIVLAELNRHVRGQAEAATQTDAGKIAMAKSHLDDVNEQVGKALSEGEVSLIPTYNKVADSMSSAFDSGPVQGLLKNLGQIEKVVLPAIGAFQILKKIISGISTIKDIVGGVKKIFSRSAGGAAGEGAAVEEGAAAGEGVAAGTELAAGGTELAAGAGVAAAEGAGLSLAASTGVGLAVLAVGYGIYKLYTYCKEKNDAAVAAAMANIDKLYNVADLNKFHKADNERFEDIKNRAATFKSLSKRGKEALYGDATITLNNERAMYPVEEKRVDSLRQAYLKATKVTGTESVYDSRNSAGIPIRIGEKKVYAEKDEAKRNRITQLYFDGVKKFNNTVDNIMGLKGVIGVLRDNNITHGLTYTRPPAPGGGDDNNGRGKSITNNAYQTSNISGGLGEAKVINIHIDTMQKNEVITDSKWSQKSESAIETLLRTLNNMAYSQSATM